MGQRKHVNSIMNSVSECPNSGRVPELGRYDRLHTTNPRHLVCEAVELPRLTVSNVPVSVHSHSSIRAPPEDPSTSQHSHLAFVMVSHRQPPSFPPFLESYCFPGKGTLNTNLFSNRGAIYKIESVYSKSVKGVNGGSGGGREGVGRGKAEELSQMKKTREIQPVNETRASVGSWARKACSSPVKHIGHIVGNV